MAVSSPTKKSLRLLRELGYAAYIVEAYNHPASAKHTGWAKKKDLLGLGDILALKEGETLMVNATSASNVAGHIAKYRESSHVVTALTDWLSAGNPFVLHGWDPAKDADDECLVREAYLTDGQIFWA